MRGDTIRYVRELGYHAIDQVRRNLALFLPPFLRHYALR